MKTRASCLQKRIFHLNSLARKSVNSLFLLVNINDIRRVSCCETSLFLDSNRVNISRFRLHAVIFAICLHLKLEHLYDMNWERWKGEVSLVKIKKEPGVNFIYKLKKTHHLSLCYNVHICFSSSGVNMYAMLTGKLPYSAEPFHINTLYNKMKKNDMNPIPDHLSSCKL